MGVYANLWWTADLKISSFSLLQQYIDPVTPILVAKDDFSQISQLVDDPPDLVWFGYAIIWDEIKKLE